MTEDSMPPTDELADAISAYHTHSKRINVASQGMADAIREITKAVGPYVNPAQSDSILQAMESYGNAQINLGEAMILLGVDIERLAALSGNITPPAP